MITTVRYGQLGSLRTAWAGPRYRLHLGRILFVGVALTWLLSGCTREADILDEPAIVSSEVIPFEDLFALEDTLVLDPSVIVGAIWFVDADDQGDILVTDITSGLVHLFSRTGMHLSTFDKDDCYPNDNGHYVSTARLSSDGHVMVNTQEGAVVIFDRSGNCVMAQPRLNWPLLSFCTQGDSLFTFMGIQDPDQGATIEVYSMDLELQRTMVLAPPQFRRLNLNYLGMLGRNMDCFEGGPYYKYHEDMDGQSIHRLSPVYKVRPEFFVQRDQDLPEGSALSAERRAAMNAFPRLIGLYALTDDVRMMLFSDIDESYRTESATGRSLTGLSIASNSGQFKGVSTVPHEAPYTARHGYLYFVGDSAPTPDGDVGNSTIIRYRFIPPTDG